MTLQIVRGQMRNRTIANQLGQQLGEFSLSGVLYLGYPILAAADENVHVDALLVTAEHGVVGLLLPSGPVPTEAADWEDLQSAQDSLFVALSNDLLRHQALRKGRDLAVPIETITVLPTPISPPGELHGRFIAISDLATTLGQLPPVEPGLWRPLNAALQKVSTIKPSRRREEAKTEGSKGSTIRVMERAIANLDEWQKAAAIETPEGPQRITGLAGSGKTIVLALKAAYLHAEHPDWEIAVTFQTRSLYQQFQELIERFCFEHIRDKPNWDRLHVLHAWGGSGREGLYSAIAESAGVTPRNFMYGSTKFGRDNAFAGVCGELLAEAAPGAIPATYDAVLIDEAQDLPPHFFRIVYQATKDPKRICWAYDELQNLSETAMPATAELFGTNSDGLPLVTLQNQPDSAKQDITLPVCYRNTPWALSAAHALGFAIHREPEGLVQHFDEPTLWTTIGYSLGANGQLAPGEEVDLFRAKTSYPEYFEQLLTPEDSVQCHVFASELLQYEWVADAIAQNLREEELTARDILVVIPNAYTAQPQASAIMSALIKRGIKSHLAGVNTSPDEIFQADSVAIANIFRSKGNESPMVYVVNSQHCVGGFNQISKRNILFTAITRSRAWVRIVGHGTAMESLKREFDIVSGNEFHLKFRIPTPGELATMRRINRDRSPGDVQAVEKATKEIAKAIALLEDADAGPETLSPELLATLERFLRKSEVPDALGEP